MLAACSLLRALGAVQRAMPGLVQRDVTPHNVLVSNEGEVKLADFGIALARDRTQWTRPQFIKGKLGYISPEQILGAHMGPRSDLFSMGVVLYELLCGERPWGPIRGVRQLRAVVERPPTPLSVRRATLSVALAAMVDRLVARHPARTVYVCRRRASLARPLPAGELGSLCLAASVRGAAG